MFRPHPETPGEDPIVEAEHGATDEQAAQVAEFMAINQHDFSDTSEEPRYMREDRWGDRVGGVW